MTITRGEEGGREITLKRDKTEQDSLNTMQNKTMSTGTCEGTYKNCNNKLLTAGAQIIALHQVSYSNTNLGNKIPTACKQDANKRQYGTNY